MTRYTITNRRAEQREMDDDHLTTEERRQFLTERGITFTDETLDSVFVDTVYGD
jgi:hypothetical protein